jgi:hypothetical protein
MDTKFWGPSGWKLLHLITFANAHPTSAERADLQCFFSTLPYILPCKFCRKSLSEYMVKFPLETALTSKQPYAIAKWLWEIHNCVNSKLREQKLLKEADPPFASVKKLYAAKFAAGCTRTNFEGWEFLFSVVENHPYSKQSMSGIPIKDAPETISPDDHLELNRWNRLPKEIRQKYWEQFWTCLPKVFPYPEWRKVWGACQIDWSSRYAAMKTLWGIRCSMESTLQLLNKTDYHSLCKQLRQHRSGCAKSSRARTCRKKRGTP